MPARFVLVGDVGPHNPTSIAPATIRAWVDEGVVERWGYREDIPEVYALSHVVCLPSYYREGVPKTLIEAAACGRPIVTSDMPGCRDVVRYNDKGLLVPLRAPVALAEAVRALIDDPERRAEMGRRGRQRAIAVFGRLRGRRDPHSLSAPFCHC